MAQQHLYAPPAVVGTKQMLGGAKLVPAPQIDFGEALVGLAEILTAGRGMWRRSASEQCRCPPLLAELVVLVHRSDDTGRGELVQCAQQLGGILVSGQSETLFKAEARHVAQGHGDGQIQRAGAEVRDDSLQCGSQALRQLLGLDGVGQGPAARLVDDDLVIH